MNAIALQWPVFNRAAILRGLAAGSAWGAVVATALLGLSFYQCGDVCLSQAVETMALSVAAGIVAIGPLAMLRREAQTPAQ